MVTVRDVPARQLLEKASEALKKDVGFATPEWSKYVKTGAHATRAPDNPEWWHTRVASIFRRIYLDGPVGVQRLKTYFGGRKNRGMAGHIEVRAGGKIIRTAIQQLEKAGFLEKTEKDGRKLNAKGQSYLDKVAKEVSASLKIEKPWLNKALVSAKEQQPEKADKAEKQEAPVTKKE
ncbi:MAG TPA: 30S ribosomal protein S19e [archaeon]|nr:30S ribosomal protein S19e [archaeon]HLD81043.1 30S ribosomal protein S19e [archaeon]